MVGLHLVEPVKLFFKTMFTDSMDYITIGYNAVMLFSIAFLSDIEDHIKFVIWFALSILGIILFYYNIHKRKLENERIKIENERKEIENLVFKYESLEVLKVASMLSEQEYEVLEMKIRQRREQMKNDIEKLSSDEDANSK